MYERYEVWDDALDRDPEPTQVRTGQVTGGFRRLGRQPWLDMTAGHPSTSSTTGHAIIMPNLTLCTAVYIRLLRAEWGGSQVIKLIAWGRMSSCNVPSPDTSSLSQPALSSSFRISFKTNRGKKSSLLYPPNLSSSSSLFLQISALEHCLIFLYLVLIPKKS